MASPRIAAVIVAWNCRDDAVRGMRAVLAQDEAAVTWAILIDNASTDGTSEAVAALADPRIVIVRLPENTGGAGGFATGMERAVALGANLVWCLDGDACATPGALAPLVAAAAQHPEAGAFGSAIVRGDGSGLIQECGARLSPLIGKPIFLDAGKPIAQLSPARAVHYVAACSLLARAEAIRQCGPFNAALFVFCDDIDWCLRLRHHGWTIRSVPTSLVHHPWHGAKPAKPWRVYYSTRNQLLLHATHAPRGLRFLRCWIWTAWALRWAERWRTATRTDLALAYEEGLRDARTERLGKASQLPSELNSVRSSAPATILMTIRIIARACLYCAGYQNTFKPNAHG